MTFSFESYQPLSLGLYAPSIADRRIFIVGVRKLFSMFYDLEMIVMKLSCLWCSSLAFTEASRDSSLGVAVLRKPSSPCLLRSPSASTTAHLGRYAIRSEIRGISGQPWTRTSPPRWSETKSQTSVSSRRLFTTSHGVLDLPMPLRWGPPQGPRD